MTEASQNCLVGGDLDTDNLNRENPQACLTKGCYSGCQTRWHGLESHLFDRDECVGEKKEINVFVTYADEDEEYADGYIIQILQNRGYKVVYHLVNFLADEPITTKTNV